MAVMLSVIAFARDAHAQNQDAGAPAHDTALPSAPPNNSTTPARAKRHPQWHSPAPPRQAPFADPPATGEDQPSRQRPGDADADRKALDRPGRSHRRWYGWQTLIFDGVALTLLLSYVIVQPEDDNVLPVVLGTAGTAFVLGPPIVHLAHGHPGKAGASLALRVTPLFFLLPVASYGCDDPDGGGSSSCGGGQGGRIIAALIGAFGIAAAPSIDAGYIANEDVPSERRTVSVVPWLDARTQRGGLSVAGAF